MNRKIAILAFVFLISLLLPFSPSFVIAQEPRKKEVKNATLQVSLSFSDTGEVALKVKKLNYTAHEPEEMARLLSHWFCKVLFLLPSPLPRMFLIKEAQQSLFEPKLKPADNILKKSEIEDAITLVKYLEKERIFYWIDLYLQELPNGNRGLISYLGREAIEQYTVFSWAVILQYASQNYGAKDINFIYDIMAETVAAYSGGADPDIMENIMTIPNNAYFRVKAKD